VTNTAVQAVNIQMEEAKRNTDTSLVNGSRVQLGHGTVDVSARRLVDLFPHSVVRFYDSLWFQRVLLFGWPGTMTPSLLFFIVMTWMKLPWYLEALCSTLCWIQNVLTVFIFLSSNTDILRLLLCNFDVYFTLGWMLLFFVTFAYTNFPPLQQSVNYRIAAALIHFFTTSFVALFADALTAPGLTVRLFILGSFAAFCYVTCLFYFRAELWEKGCTEVRGHSFCVSSLMRTSLMTIDLLSLRMLARMILAGNYFSTASRTNVQCTMLRMPVVVNIAAVS